MVGKTTFAYYTLFNKTTHQETIYEKGKIEIKSVLKNLKYHFSKKPIFL